MPICLSHCHELPESVDVYLGETGPLSQLSQGFKRVGRHSEYAINGMEVRKKRPRGFK